MSGNSFGRTLRAFRCGYGVSHKHKAFIRLLVGDKYVTVTLVPLSKQVPASSGKREHVVWWESEKSRKILDLIPAIKNVRNVKRTLSFDVDAETGEQILI